MRTKFLAQALILTIAIGGLTGCKNGRWFWQKPLATTGSQPGALGGTTIDSKLPDRGAYTGEEGRGDFTAVLFDYDSSKIRPTEFAKLETVASALKGNSQKLVVEGHTDERGTAEYNRSLGEKRALSARQALISLGVAATRISTVSYGKDRPVEASHDDTAWSRNRRCEFVLVSQ